MVHTELRLLSGIHNVFFVAAPGGSRLIIIVQELENARAVFSRFAKCSNGFAV